MCVCVCGGEGGGLHEWCEGVKGWGESLGRWVKEKSFQDHQE